MKMNTKALSYGAMCAAIMGLFYILNLFTGGWAEVITLFIAPLPLTIYTVQYGYKNSIIVWIATVFIGVITAGMVNIFMLSAAFLSGIGLGYFMAKPSSKVVRYLSVVIVLLVANILSMVVFASIFGYDLMAESEFVASTVLEMVPYSGFGMDELMAMMPTVILFSIVLESVCSGFVSYYLAVIVLNRLHFYIQPVKTMNKMVKPVLGYLGMGGYILFLMMDHVSLDPSMYALVSLMGMIAQFALAIYGVTTLSRYGRTTNKLWISVLMIIVLIFLPSIALFIFACIGFLRCTTTVFNGVDQQGKDDNSR